MCLFIVQEIKEKEKKKKRKRKENQIKEKCTMTLYIPNDYEKEKRYLCGNNMELARKT